MASRAAEARPAAANSAATRATAWRKVTIGSSTASFDKIATSPATPRTVPICLAMLSMPLPVPNLAGGSDVVPAPSSEGIVSPTPAPPSNWAGSRWVR